VPARVLVVAASAAAQAELEGILAGRPAINIAGRAAPGPDLARIVGDLHPDVIVFDGDATLSSSFPASLTREVAIVALLDDPATQSAAALRAGARAALRRDASPAELTAAIEAVSAGLVVLHASAVPRLPRAEAAGEPLTRREREILTLLADGLGNKTIAARLGISDHTVKAHVGAIFDKLHVGTRAEAVALGLRLGLIAL
jgi:DNA-binding NarL/FixJ family response regulator